MTTVLVAGATGALRPAALRLAGGGLIVTGLARQVDLPGVTALETDWTDPAAVRDALAGRSFDAALLYCPTAAADSVAAMVGATTGRVVRLLTSAVAAPPFDLADLPPDRAVRLVLGWAPGPRWHTPEEVSRAALDVLRDGADTVLGAIRPWADRPR